MFSKPVSIEKPPIFTTINAQKNAGKVEVFIHIIIFTCYNDYVASIIIKDKPPTSIGFLIGSPAKVNLPIKNVCGRVYFFFFTIS
ncbi:hypothetical protein BM74_33165 [Bacillus thuringiensis]|uniref:Uncharacterized protein n=1 Tax=Bacillus thuringiensis TaxID=1428 RepID=A0A437SAR5_BACTU|nr:hypothetical protein BM74_33165 [Bacillus thuringiensis]